MNASFRTVSVSSASSAELTKSIIGWIFVSFVSGMVVSLLSGLFFLALGLAFGALLIFLLRPVIYDFLLAFLCFLGKAKWWA